MVSDRYMYTVPCVLLVFLSVFFGYISYVDRNPLIAFIVIAMIGVAIRLRLASNILITKDEIWFDGFLRHKRIPLDQVTRVSSARFPSLYGLTLRLVLEGQDERQWIPRFYGSSPFVSMKPAYVDEMVANLETALQEQGWEPG